MSAPAVMKLHVEGWRRINHSYALVNRNHLRWLLKDPRLSITHREMPYFKAHWAANPNHSFPAAFEAVLNLPDQDAPPDVDITLRMDFPHRFDKPARGKLVVFGTTEYTHISPENLRGDVAAAASDPEVFILTPSQWSAQGFLKLGFPQERVWVLPHGVDKEHFRITTLEEKARYRALLGIDQHAKVFLHVGGGWFGKGLDLLIEAFSIHAKSHPRSRLVIKGHDALYGNAVLNAFANRPLSLPPGVELAREQILYLGGDLSDESMDHLYRLADCYVATYRGEGFNMPLLEAAARGLEVIASSGGSADDFLRLFQRATRLKSSLALMPDGQGFIQVERGDLVNALSAQSLTRPEPTMMLARELSARADAFSWEAVGAQLAGGITEILARKAERNVYDVKRADDAAQAVETFKRKGPSINVAFCADAGYIPQLGAALVSLFRSNWMQELQVYVVTTDLTAENRAKLEQLALTYGRVLNFFDLNVTALDGLVEYVQPKSTYYRLLLPALLQHLDRVIYLDCDLVVESPLAELWAEPMHEHLVLGVAEREALQAGMQAHVETPGDPYINAGVLVMNLAAWRREAIAARCLAWLHANPARATMMDQDAINRICTRRKGYVPLKWNLNPIHGPATVTLPQFPERILHFAGPIKPWHAWYCHHLKDIFYHYLDATPWQNALAIKEPQTPGQCASTANQWFEAGDIKRASTYYVDCAHAIKAHVTSLPESIGAILEQGKHLHDQQLYQQACDCIRSTLSLWGIPARHGDIYKIPGIM